MKLRLGLQDSDEVKTKHRMFGMVQTSAVLPILLLETINTHHIMSTEVIPIEEVLPGICYQLSTWIKCSNGEHQSKKFVFMDEDEAVAAYHEVKAKAERINQVQRRNVKAGCNLYVCIDGERDYIESFKLFSNRLYDEAALATR